MERAVAAVLSGDCGAHPRRAREHGGEHQVLESLFPTSCRTSRDKSIPPRPENKRVWASPLKGKTVVIREVAEEMDRRDRSRSLTRVTLTDGERALQIRVKLKLHVTLILDLRHVLEKLWKAAYVLHAEGSLEANLWVLDRTLRILLGEVGQVVKGIRQTITKRGLSGAKRKTMEAVAGYFTGIERACNMTNTSLTRGPLPVVRSKAPARTSSKTTWSAPGYAGPSRWLRPSSNSEPSTSPEILIATGNSTSNRINSGYMRPTGPSFQSSRTLCFECASHTLRSQVVSGGLARHYHRLSTSSTRNRPSWRASCQPTPLPARSVTVLQHNIECAEGLHCGQHLDGEGLYSSVHHGFWKSMDNQQKPAGARTVVRRRHSAVDFSHHTNGLSGLVFDGTGNSEKAVAKL